MIVIGCIERTSEEMQKLTGSARGVPSLIILSIY
jgi:hypothetical protein